MGLRIVCAGASCALLLGVGCGESDDSPPARAPGPVSGAVSTIVAHCATLKTPTPDELASVKIAVDTLAQAYRASPGQTYVFDTSDPSPETLRSVLEEMEDIVSGGRCHAFAGTMKAALAARQ